ncbi:hypothetical protein VTJ04DRAFT_5418 [Mycothermus thermophilus]|uniref:uncharacterized protein n=1 Tax=Humicola insolens TaxID=85995 RepID=UPI003742DAA1
MVSPTLARRAYQSPHGPKYYFQTQVAGITTQTLIKTGIKTGLFGGVGLFTLIYFASGLPRVRQDILQKLPLIGDKFKKEIPASDNPF